MSDNPFAEPEDDRTVFRPMPGGQRAAARVAPRPAVSAPLRPSRDERSRNERAEAGGTAADPAGRRFADAGRRVHQPADRRGRAAAATARPAAQHALRRPTSGDCATAPPARLREFERRAREAGRADGAAAAGALRAVRQHRRRGAEHALGRARRLAPSARWSASFHGDTRRRRASSTSSGRCARTRPSTWPVIELMYLCLSLGFMGPLPRRRRTATSEWTGSASRPTTLIAGAASRGGPDPDLSRALGGRGGAYRPRRAAVSGLGRALRRAGRGGRRVRSGCSNGLNAASDRFFRRRRWPRRPRAMPQIARAAVWFARHRRRPSRRRPVRPTGCAPRWRRRSSKRALERARHAVGDDPAHSRRSAVRRRPAPPLGTASQAAARAGRRGAEAEPGHGSRAWLHRQLSRSAPCSSRPTSSSRARARQCGAGRACDAQLGDPARRRPPKGAPTPIRSPRTPPPRAASRTGGSRSCCRQD